MHWRSLLCEFQLYGLSRSPTLRFCADNIAQSAEVHRGAILDHARVKHVLRVAMFGNYWVRNDWQPRCQWRLRQRIPVE